MRIVISHLHTWDYAKATTKSKAHQILTKTTHFIVIQCTRRTTDIRVPRTPAETDSGDWGCGIKNMFLVCADLVHDRTYITR